MPGHMPLAVQQKWLLCLVRHVDPVSLALPIWCVPGVLLCSLSFYRTSAVSVQHGHVYDCTAVQFLTAEIQQIMSITFMYE